MKSWRINNRTSISRFIKVANVVELTMTVNGSDDGTMLVDFNAFTRTGCLKPMLRFPKLKVLVAEIKIPCYLEISSTCLEVLKIKFTGGQEYGADLFKDCHISRDMKIYLRKHENLKTFHFACRCYRSYHLGRYMGEQFPNIEDFKMSGKLKEADLTNMLLFFPNLKKLSVDVISKILVFNKKKIATYPSLTSLQLTNFILWGAAIMKSLITMFPNLKYLDLTHCSLAFKAIKVLIVEVGTIVLLLIVHT